MTNCPALPRVFDGACALGTQTTKRVGVSLLPRVNLTCPFLDQDLADKASIGMTHAKALFASAISERKKAVASEATAAKDVIAAATRSEQENRDVAALRRVRRGDLAGAAAQEAVVAADASAVDAAEGDLGKAKQTLEAGRARGATLAGELAEVQQHLDALRKDFTVAQGEVSVSRR